MRPISEISRLIGMPTHWLDLRGVSSKADPTKCAPRAPTLLAKPGRAFASWMTTGMPSRRAAT